MSANTGGDSCPKCGNDLEFGAFEVEDGMTGYYPCVCSDKCGFEGRQWFTLEFDVLQERLPMGEYIDLPKEED